MNGTVDKPKAIIMGAGLSGLALAVELVDEGFEVIVMEKHNILGGRASNYIDHPTNLPVHNGPHVFVMAYNNLQRFFKKIGSENNIEWQTKVFLEVYSEGKHHVINNNILPPPWYLLPFTAQYGLVSWKDRLSNANVIKDIASKSYEQLEELDNMSAYDYLKKMGVTENAISRMWGMLTLSLLNVPLTKASAAEFSILVKEWSWLWHRNLGFARGGQGDIYTENAKKYIESKGGQIINDAEIIEIDIADNQIRQVTIDHNGIHEIWGADVFVSTLTPTALREVLPKATLETEFFSHLKEFEPVPYISVHLWFDGKVTDKQFWALLGDATQERKYINTDFYDLSNIFMPRLENSYITSNIIYSQEYEELSDERIIQTTLAELKTAFPDMTANLIHSRINRLPYVIYAPKPGMRQHRLPNKTPISNFYLAGDWTYKRMTQCMEAAVRSGYKCAETVLADFGTHKTLCDDRLS